MNKHPSYPILAPYLSKYPHAAGSLFQAYNDVVYAQKWYDIEVLDLDKCRRGAIRGRKQGTDACMYVIPCSLSETISTELLQNAFSSLSNPPEIYVGITSDDASIVYYKISSGIVKPPV